MSKIGTADIKGIMLGSTEISKAYLGSEIVYQKSSPLPYDAEIEWLESSGNGGSSGQVINSNVLIPANCRHVEYHFKFLFVKNQKGVLCGHQKSGYGNPRTYLFYSKNARYTRDFYAGNLLGNVYINPQEVVEGYVTLDEDTGKLCFYRNGTLSNEFTMSGSALNRNYPIRFFGGSYANKLDDLASIRMWKFSIIHGSNLVRDYIPVRVGQVGYMYDKVSGQLFGNAGTGNFTLGSDKN